MAVAIAPAEPRRSFTAMGGTVRLRVACAPDEVDPADRELRMLEGRLHAWAGRLSRFDPTSDLRRLNQHSAAGAVAVRPTLGSVMAAAGSLSERTDRMVDITLLDERLAAQAGSHSGSGPATWAIEPTERRWLVSRQGRFSFDLDGVAKGWLADRALARLGRFSSAMVDADGDVALRLSEEADWHIGIADPLGRGDVAILRIPTGARSVALGLATSGTTVHRWQHGIGWAHHLIDPRSGRPAVTDVVQATIAADSALLAEGLAKAVVISGSDDGLSLAERAEARAAILVLESGEVVATARSKAWLC